MMKRIIFTFLVSLPFFTFSKRHDFNIVLNVIDKAQHALSPAHIFKKITHVLLSGAAENLNNTAAKQRARFQQRYQEEQRAIEENKRFLQKIEQQRQQAAVSTGTFTTVPASPPSPQPNPLPNHHKIAESFHRKSDSTDDHYRKRKESLDRDIHNNWCAYSDTYKLSHESQQLLQTYQLSWHEGQFCGTYLQHQLHQETLACLGQAALLNNKVTQPTIQSLVYTTASMSCAADEYNKLRAIERSCILLDTCHSLLDYGYAIVDCCLAAGQGVIAGIEHTLETAEWIEQQTLNFALKPQETREKFVKSLNKAATNLALFIKEFCPLTINLSDLYCTDYYLNYNLRIVDNWQNTIANLWQQVKNMPPREIVKGTAQLITENIVLEKSFAALGSFGAAAKAELQAIDYAKFHKLPAGAVPGFLIIEHTQAAQKIISFAEQSSIATLETITKALECVELPTIGGNISRLGEAITVFEHTEGFKEVFERMIERCLEKETHDTAKRYLYKIEKQLVKVEQNEISPTDIKFSLPENFATNPPNNIIVQGARYKTLSNGKKCRIIAPENVAYAETEWAKAQYEKIRHMKDDITVISQNTGWPYKRIARIKNHLFYDEHILSNRIGQFDPDVEIASAWDRLVRGDFVQNDIDLLMHEYLESKCEKLLRIDATTSHKYTKACDRVWKTPK